MNNPLLGAAKKSAGSKERLYQPYTLKCKKCGREFTVILSPDEYEKLNKGVSIKELFERKSPILREQIKNEYCDRCFILHYKEANHGIST